MSDKTPDPDKARKDKHNDSTSVKGLGGSLLALTKPYLPPYAAWAATGVTAALVAVPVQNNPVPMGIGLGLGSLGLTAATWLLAKGLESHWRYHATGTVGAATMWVTTAALTGYNTFTADTFTVGGLTVSLSWTIHQLAGHKLDKAAARRSSQDGGSGDLMAKVKLAGTKVGKTTVEPNRVTAELELPAGEMSNEDVKRALPNLASALDVPTTAVRFSGDPDSARRGTLVIVPEDMLKDARPWEGPTAVGGSIAEPLVIGRYDDGAPLQLWLPGDPEVHRNSTHLLICGTTGSGKGDGALNVMTEILSRRDVLVWLSDPKSFQDFRPLLPGIDWAVEGGEATETMVEAVRAAIPDRTRWLGAHGYRQWLPEAAVRQTDASHTCSADGRPCGCPGMPFIVSWFEEAAASIRFMGDDGFIEVAQLARAAGISLVISLQRPSHDQMSTTVRSSLPSVLTFGLSDGREVAMALPVTVVDAGADPSVWGNRRPGYCYLVSPGIPEARYATPARTQWFTPLVIPKMKGLAMWTERNGAQVDPVTEASVLRVAGKAFSGRKESSDTLEMPVIQVPAADLSKMPSEASVDEDDDMGDIDPYQELPPVPESLSGFTFGNQEADEVAALTPEEARTAMDEIVSGFENAGTMVIGPKDAVQEASAFGRSRQWVSLEFQRLIAEGRIVATSKPGRYRIVPQAG